MRIGITGGIGSGKSAVSRICQANGIPVIDADVVAREVVQIGTPGLHAIVQTFGHDVLHADGSLNRSLLGTMIFTDEQKRQQLDAICKPLIFDQIVHQLNTFHNHEHVVVDIPLLYEQPDYIQLVDQVWVVYANDSVRRERIMNRNGLSIEEAQARIDAQMPLLQKCELADEIIDNNHSVDQLELKVKALLRKYGVIQ